MKVEWCEEHRAAFEPLDPNPAATPGVCIIEEEFGVGDPTNCRMVGMELHPEGTQLAVYRQGVIDGKTEGFDVGYQQGYAQGYREGNNDAAVISSKHEATELLIADIVQKAHPYGVQDGDFIASYLLPTGPIHRAIKYLNEHGIRTEDL